MTQNVDLPPEVATRYGDKSKGIPGGGQMDAGFEARLRAVEGAMIETRAAQTGHERLCAERYDAIRKDIQHGMSRQATGLKWIAIAVGVLALVVTGQATVADIVRSGAARIGVQVHQAAPATGARP